MDKKIQDIEFTVVLVDLLEAIGCRLMDQRFSNIVAVDRKPLLKLVSTVLIFDNRVLGCSLLESASGFVQGCDVV